MCCVTPSKFPALSGPGSPHSELRILVSIMPQGSSLHTVRATPAYGLRVAFPESLLNSGPVKAKFIIWWAMMFRQWIATNEKGTGFHHVPPFSPPFSQHDTCPPLPSLKAGFLDSSSLPILTSKTFVYSPCSPTLLILLSLKPSPIHTYSGQPSSSRGHFPSWPRVGTPIYEKIANS